MRKTTIKFLLAVLICLTYAATASAHPFLVTRTQHKAVKIMRGDIASECPGSNHWICFARGDAYVYRTSRHCWSWRSSHTHLEGNNPWVLKVWYGSEGGWCPGHGIHWHREF